MWLRQKKQKQPYKPHQITHAHRLSLGKMISTYDYGGQKAWSRSIFKKSTRHCRRRIIFYQTTLFSQIKHYLSLLDSTSMANVLTSYVHQFHLFISSFTTKTRHNTYTLTNHLNPLCILLARSKFRPDSLFSRTVTLWNKLPIERFLGFSILKFLKSKINRYLSYMNCAS